MVLYNIISAREKNHGIGYNNSIPWSHKDDLKFFSKITKGNGNNAIIMGKNTYLSIGKPLKGRINIIISKTLKEKDENLKIFENIDDAINFCNINNFSEVWICGGEKIYNEFLNNYKNIINFLYINDLQQSYECDTFLKIPDEYKLFKSELKNYTDGIINHSIYTSK